jgi:D-alanyl-D-alanine carboxypeptidase/D-alanyl-D-alanine-endopeptidase (penicillin-binding protein 4)
MTHPSAARRWRWFLPFIVLVLAPSATGQTGARLPAGIEVVVSGHDLPPDAYTLLVQEVGTASPLLSVNPDQSFNPASTIKIFTTLAGLELLGADYTWETGIFTMGPVTDGTLEGDLLVRGGGDPFLVEEHFRAMLKVLMRRGVERIRGDLVIDDSLFDPSVLGDPPIDDEIARSYNVLPHALSTNFQTVNFYFYPHPNGRDVTLVADPDLPNLTITNRLRQADRSCGGFQRGIRFDIDPSVANGVIFSGQYPSRCDEYVLSRAVLDAPAYAFGLFQVLWRQLGGEFDGGLRLGAAPRDREPLVRWTSPPLGDVVQSINKFSNNLMARHLLLTVGVERFGPPATVENGIRALEEYLDSRDIGRDGLVLVNGAGLSRETRVTGAMIRDVLEHGYRTSTMAELVASLPLAGIDGTMRTRLAGAPAVGNAHVKTGSLDGVAALAGYVHARSGTDYVVVGILNHPLADIGPGQELMDALLAWAHDQ